MWGAIQSWSERYRHYVNRKVASWRSAKENALHPARAVITPERGLTFLLASVSFALVWLALSIWAFVVAIRCVVKSQGGMGEKVLTLLLFIILGPFYLIYYYATHNPSLKYCSTAVDQWTSESVILPAPPTELLVTPTSAIAETAL